MTRVSAWVPPNAEPETRDCMHVYLGKWPQGRMGAVKSKTVKERKPSQGCIIRGSALWSLEVWFCWESSVELQKLIQTVYWVTQMESVIHWFPHCGQGCSMRWDWTLTLQVCGGMLQNDTEWLKKPHRCPQETNEQPRQKVRYQWCTYAGCLQVLPAQLWVQQQLLAWTLDRGTDTEVTDTTLMPSPQVSKFILVLWIIQYSLQNQFPQLSNYVFLEMLCSN